MSHFKDLGTGAVGAEFHRIHLCSLAASSVGGRQCLTYLPHAVPS